MPNRDSTDKNMSTQTEQQQTDDLTISAEEAETLLNGLESLSLDMPYIKHLQRPLGLIIDGMQALNADIKKELYKINPSAKQPSENYQS